MCDKRTITYCIDLLIPGIYLWLGNKGIKLGGTEVDATYPNFSIKTVIGFAIVLPNLKSFITPTGLLDNDIRQT